VPVDDAAIPVGMGHPSYSVKDKRRHQRVLDAVKEALTISFETGAVTEAQLRRIVDLATQRGQRPFDEFEGEVLARFHAAAYTAAQLTMNGALRNVVFGYQGFDVGALAHIKQLEADNKLTLPPSAIYPEELRVKGIGCDIVSVGNFVIGAFFEYTAEFGKRYGTALPALPKSKSGLPTPPPVTDELIEAMNRRW
jgi:hypothetical protein